VTGGATMDVRYVPNPAGLRAMKAAPFMVEAMRDIAEEGKKRAEAIAPERTGRYRWGTVKLDQQGNAVTRRRRTKTAGRGRTKVKDGGGFHVDAGVRAGRAYARLSNDTPYAYFLEHGTRYMERQRILGRAIDSMRI
jgi:hypothetical protein